jgi:predicted ArsR family transcriptional regulator
MISADHASDLTRKARNSVEKTLKEVVEPAIIEAANRGESMVYVHLGNAAYKINGNLGWFVVSDADDAKRKRIVAALDDLGYDASPVTKRVDEHGNGSFGVVVEW